VNQGFGIPTERKRGKPKMDSKLELISVIAALAFIALVGATALYAGCSALMEEEERQKKLWGEKHGWW
jgi:hypothetical protein